jgi:hypothetical protein
MDETSILNAEDDRYADSKSGVCAECPLPKMLTTYEVGFKMVLEQLSDLRRDLKQLVNKIDKLEHNRNI